MSTFKLELSEESNANGGNEESENEVEDLESGEIEEDAESNAGDEQEDGDEQEEDGDEQEEEEEEEDGDEEEGIDEDEEDEEEQEQKEADVDEEEENEIESLNNGDEEDKQNKKKLKYKAPKKVAALSSTNFSYNVDDELFVDEQNFEKIDESIKKSYIDSYHPECIHKNYDEMFKLTFITRKNNIIDDPNHRTIPFLTKYEKTKIIGLRVKQLNNGAKPFINIEEIFHTKVVLDNYLIAEKELNMKRLPFIISRPITNKHNEYWNLKDLEII